MLDSPLTILLFGISAASGIASLMARRRAQPTLASLSDEDLIAALANLHPTNPEITARRHAPHAGTGPAFGSHSDSEICEVVHPKCVSSVSEHDEEWRLSSKNSTDAGQRSGSDEAGKLLGLCERTWRPEYNAWSHTCDAGPFLIVATLFLSLAIALVVLCVGGVIAEINKAKRSGVHVDAIIRDARSRSHQRG